MYLSCNTREQAEATHALGSRQYGDTRVDVAFDLLGASFEHWAAA